MKITIEFTESSENEAIINYLKKLTDVIKFLNNFSVLQKPKSEPEQIPQPKIKEKTEKKKHQFPLKSFNCELCGEKFERNARFARYCSDCKDDKIPLHKREYKKESKKSRFKVKQFICVNCKQVFEKTATTAKYCTKCKEEISPKKKESDISQETSSKKKSSEENINKSLDNLNITYKNGVIIDVSSNLKKENIIKFENSVKKAKENIINGEFTGKIIKK